MVYDPNKAGIWSSGLLQTKAADVDHVVEDALLVIPKTMVLLKARSCSQETHIPMQVSLRANFCSFRLEARSAMKQSSIQEVAI